MAWNQHGQKQTDRCRTQHITTTNHIGGLKETTKVKASLLRVLGEPDKGKTKGKIWKGLDRSKNKTKGNHHGNKGKKRHHEMEEHDHGTQ